jgi:hypothetical protein
MTDNHQALDEEWAFKSCQNKGFALKLNNGWTVSVQWGPGNYGSNYNDSWEAAKEAHTYSSKATAEVAAWNDKGAWYDPETNGPFTTTTDEDGDLITDRTWVGSYLTVGEVIAFINKIGGLER